MSEGALRLDLDENPCTQAGSRLLLQQTPDGDGVRVRAAVFERPVDRCRIVEVRVLAGGRVLRPSGSAESVSFGEDRVRLVAGDTDTLSLELPAGPSEVLLALEGAPAIVADGGAAPTSLDGTAVAWRVDGVEVAQAVEGGTDGRPVVRITVGGDGDGARLALALVPEPVPVMPGIAAHREVEAAGRAWWDAWMRRRPAVRADLAPMADLAWWTLGANQVEIAGHGRRRTVAASKLGYVAAWQWDSYFVAMGLRHGEPALAWDQVAFFLDHQAPDGQLPDVVSDEGTVSSVRDLPPGEARPDELEGPDTPITKPPIGPWAAWAVHELLGDEERLAWALPRLAACQRWWDTRCDANGDGLAEYLHRFSSGLDDSPLFDVPGVVEPPDLNSYLAVGDDRLARMAAVLGRPGEADAFERSAGARVDRLVATRWDLARGRFRTMRGDTEVDVLTPFALMPLLTGRLSASVADAAIATLTDPRRLWTAWPLPTVAADEPAFDPDHMWRGPVWLGVNRLLVEGLEVSGRPDLARELAERTLAMAARSSSLYEHWNPVTGGRPSTATTCFSWSAAAYLDLAVSVSR